MARLDNLAAQVKDSALREKLQDAIADLKRKQRFGLVFEEHIPEITALLGHQIHRGATVQRREDPNEGVFYRVISVNGRGEVNIELLAGGEPLPVPSKDLLLVKQLGDPIYPALTSVGVIRRGPATKPHHAVIDGENFHALQLFAYLYEGRADCIYIDPPYNTGARDWKYNNRYVDKNDPWRHSKWLSMMEKRLRLARRLLKPDGVLICTIDEHELNHLGMLMEKIFPEYLQYMVTIVINPKGREKANFAPVDECAFFIVPNTGQDVILRAPGGPPMKQNIFQMPEEEEGSGDLDDDENEIDESASDDEDESEESSGTEWEYRHARRRGGGAEASSYRERRPNQFYPIYIDEKARKVVRVGQSIPLDQDPSFEEVDGLRPIWPIDGERRHRCWAFIPSSMQRIIDEGHVSLGKFHAERNDWTIRYRVPKKTTRKLKTVWWEKAHDAGTHGTELLKKLLGHPGLFPFPKSVYAVKDCLAAVVRNRPNALIVDFFAGSGTTLHATCLLNAEDDGNRRSILVTNNEIEEKLATKLHKQGIHQGDLAFEKHGIFSQVTRPRCEAVISGRRPDGTLVPGKHLDARGRPKGRAFSKGFEENVEFFRIDYLDPDDVDLGYQFDAILPSIWLASGGVGTREICASKKAFSMPADATYGVLFREAAFRKFKDEIEKRPEVSHVWLVTDSEEAFAEMRSALSAQLSVSMLYRDYLRNFRINTSQSL
jgi:adenine-specific DNA-methyltransferase